MILKESQLKKRYNDDYISGEETRYNCPYCDDTSGHCYVNSIKQVWHCFKCGRGGCYQPTHYYYNVQYQNKVFSDATIKGLTENKDTVEIIKKKMKNSGMYVEGKEILSDATIRGMTENKEVRTLPRMVPIKVRGNELGGAYLNDPPFRPVDYLVKSRGLTYEEIGNNKLGWCPDKEGPYANSIVFPVNGDRYFTCRKLEGKPKYVNAPWPKDKVYEPRTSYAGDYRAVVEGPVDAIKTGRIMHCYALLGKQANKQQLEQMIRINMTNKFVTLLDPDAWIASVNLKLGLLAMADQLGKKIQVVNVFLDQWDPGDIKTEELQKVIQDAIKRFK